MSAMHKAPLVLAALLSAAPALPQVAASASRDQALPAPLAPGEIVAAAPKAEWVAIAPSDLLVMDLAPDVKRKTRRVVIQLMPPPFSQGWIGNIRNGAVLGWHGGEPGSGQLRGTVGRSQCRGCGESEEAASGLGDGAGE
jgi:hypothetical protein